MNSLVELRDGPSIHATRDLPASIVLTYFPLHLIQSRRDLTAYVDIPEDPATRVPMPIYLELANNTWTFGYGRPIYTSGTIFYFDLRRQDSPRFLAHLVRDGQPPHANARIDWARGRPCLCATRTILRDEEILHDYGNTYWLQYARVHRSCLQTIEQPPKGVLTTWQHRLFALLTIRLAETSPHLITCRWDDPGPRVYARVTFASGEIITWYPAHIVVIPKTWTPDRTLMRFQLPELPSNVFVHRDFALYGGMARYLQLRTLERIVTTDPFRLIADPAESVVLGHCIRQSAQTPANVMLRMEPGGLAVVTTRAIGVGMELVLPDYSNKAIARIGTY